MPTTNLREIGFEDLITKYLVETNSFQQKFYSGEHSGHYDHKEAMDTVAVFEFLERSQPQEMEKLKLNYGSDYQKRFLERLQKEIREKGILAVLKQGVKDRNCHFRLMYFVPNSSLNPELEMLWSCNSFVVARQLYYSTKNKNSVDMVVLINGLPIITLELKNLLTGQTVKHAINQYKTDRSSREELFKFERCLVHFAVDTEQVYMTTKLEDDKTWFLPFNKGYNGGAGNPPSETGIRTGYLWQEILTKTSLSRLISDFVQSLSENKNSKISKKLIFPRYHQFQVVSKLLLESKSKGMGQKFLIQHSAGSGKSNSIAWLSHQLAKLFAEDGFTNVFDTILVITDRQVLDKQLRENITSFDHQSGLIETITDGSRQLKQALEDGKRIIITTIQKFPVIVEEMGELTSKKFAVIIDEAHSSTSGETIAKMNKTIKADLLDGEILEEEITAEDVILETLQARRMLGNASYFAFTATPKNKTLELFGIQNTEGKYQPFDSYTMKQAIEEGFILDVLSNYTTYNSYYGLTAIDNQNKEYSKKKANSQMKKFVESHSHTIESKSEIMLEHFYQNVYLKSLVGGRAKAMVVCSSRLSAAKYHFAFQKIIRQKNYPMHIITAFSGDIELDGVSWSESNLNQFSSAKIPEYFESGKDGHSYQFLICANKYQTGFDQPLLQTMYVDKKLGGVGAVQTLSRLNRVHKDKQSVFVLDFYNTEDDIKQAFEPYYQTTVLSAGSDPNRLHDIKDQLDTFGVYTDFAVHKFTTDLLSGVPAENLHSLLDSVVENIKKLYPDQIDEFKSKAKLFTKFYAFISQIITFEEPLFEELHQFLKVLIKKIVDLGTKEDILSQDVLDSVDFDSYRNQVTTSNARISLSESDELSPIPSSSTNKNAVDEKDILENIVGDFNTRFGTDFDNEDTVKKLVIEISDELTNSQEKIQSLQDSDRYNRKLTNSKLTDAKVFDVIGKADDYLKFVNNYSNNPDFKEHILRAIDQMVDNKLKKLL
jgi:type I restriction enzyme, R subunit